MHGFAILLGVLSCCYATAPPYPATVSAGVPTLVAATQTQILWYPLLSYTFTSPGGHPAILMRAQSCGDVNTDTTDTAFVSYDDGSTRNGGFQRHAVGIARRQSRVCRHRYRSELQLQRRPIGTTGNIHDHVRAPGRLNPASWCCTILMSVVVLVMLVMVLVVVVAAANLGSWTA